MEQLGFLELMGRAFTFAQAPHGCRPAPRGDGAGQETEATSFVDLKATLAGRGVEKGG
jgi:hypothetical protein